MSDDKSDFINDPRIRVYVDPVSGEIVWHCVSCTAHGRLAFGALENFNLTHAPGCAAEDRNDPTPNGRDKPVGLELVQTTENERLPHDYQLVLDILSHFSDECLESAPRHVLSVLAFATALVCTYHEEEANESVNFTIRALQQHVEEVSAAERARDVPLAMSLRDHGSQSDDPDGIAGRALGDKVRGVIAEAAPNVALIALQHAVVEEVLGLDQDHLAVIQGCTAAMRQMVLKVTPWRITQDPNEQVH